MRINNPVKRGLVEFLCLIPSLAPMTTSAALTPIVGVPSKSLTDVLDDLTKWILTFGLALCVILIIWGGLNYVASTGDTAKSENAKKTIHYAIYGIAIIGLSFAMIKVISDTLTT